MTSKTGPPSNVMPVKRGWEQSWYRNISQYVAFASRAFTSTEQGYAQVEKEGLAIVFSCEKFGQYLYGQEKITMESDHKPLEIIFKKSLLSAPKRLQQCCCDYRSSISVFGTKKSTGMCISDMLSRAFHEQRHSPQEIMEQILALKQEGAFQRELEHINQSKHEAYNQLLDPSTYECLMSAYIKSRLSLQHSAVQAQTTRILADWPDDRDSIPKSIEEYYGYWDELTVHNGVLYKGMQVIIPRAMWPEMLTQINASHQEQRQASGKPEMFSSGPTCERKSKM